MNSLVQLGAMAGATVTNPEEGSLENKISVMATQAIDGWRSVDLDGMLPGHGSPMPAAFAATILPLELALHGWDLAQTSGQAVHISDELVAYLRTLAEILIPSGRGSSFGEEVTPADGATEMDKLAAYAGRTAQAA
jgi:uncharacterized protein (TIGR03086 family)